MASKTLPGPADDAATAEREPADQAEDPDQGEEQHEGLIRAFRQRLDVLWKAEGHLRLVPALAVIQLLACAVLVNLQAFLGPQMPIGSDSGRLVVQPVVIFAAGVVFAAAGWAFMLTGALHSHWVLKVIGLVVFAALFIPILTAASINTVVIAVTLAIYLAVLVAGVVIWVISIRHPRRFRLREVAIMFVLILALYLGAWGSSAMFNGQLLFAFGLGIQLLILQFLIVPILLLAGTDFAEWGEAAGERLFDLLKGLRPPWSLVAVTALVAAGILAGILRNAKSPLGPEFVVAPLYALSLVGVALAARLHRRTSRAVVPMLAPLLFTIVFITIFTVAAAIVVVPASFRASPHPKVGTYTDASTYVRSQEPAFSINYPGLWKVQVLKDGGVNGVTQVQFSGSSEGNPGFFTVAAVPAAASPADPLGDLLKPCCTGWQNQTLPVTGPEGWSAAAIALISPDQKGYVGSVWERTAGGRTWVLFGITPQAIAAFNNPVFSDMLASWSPTPAKAAAATDNGQALRRQVSGLWVSMLGLAVLFLLVRRRPRAGLVTGLVFVSVASSFFVFTQLKELPAVGDALSRVPGLRDLTIAGLQASMAVATLLVVAWLVGGRRLDDRHQQLLSMLLTLNVGLQLLSWMYDVYAASMNANYLSGLAATFIVLALMWDVVMGGGAVVSVDGRWFPKRARMLLYKGYLVLVAVTVMYYASQRLQVSGASLGSQFQTDFWAQSGLYALGVPLLVTLFVLRLARWGRGGRRESRSDPGLARTGTDNI